MGYKVLYSVLLDVVRLSCVCIACHAIDSCMSCDRFLLQVNACRVALKCRLSLQLLTTTGTRVKRKATQKRRRRSQTRERSLRRKNVPVPVVVRGDRVGDHATPSWDVILATRTTSAGRKEKGDVQKGMDAVGGVGSTR